MAQRHEANIRKHIGTSEEQNNTNSMRMEQQQTTSNPAGQNLPPQRRAQVEELQNPPSHRQSSLCWKENLNQETQWRGSQPLKSMTVSCRALCKLPTPHLCPRRVPRILMPLMGEQPMLWPYKGGPIRIWWCGRTFFPSSIPLLPDPSCK